MIRADPDLAGALSDRRFANEGDPAIKHRARIIAAG
jgi:hypothetical protein